MVDKVKIAGVLLMILAFVSLFIMNFDLLVFVFLIIMGVILIFSEPEDPHSKEFRVFHRSYEDFEQDFFRRKW